MSIYMI